MKILVANYFSLFIVQYPLFIKKARFLLRESGLYITADTVLKIVRCNCLQGSYIRYTVDAL